MASIAYITDKNMIEYHRLNGNHTINFWKPSNTKKMSDFHSGDFLFFLAKGTEKGQQREKGIIGYGKFKKNYTMTFSQMWNRFETKNGYSNKESLAEAIMKVTKNHKLPDTLHCLILEDLVFFQAPVYLSEIGVEISNKIESYIYLDKGDMLNTTKILEVANQVGVDVWSSLFHKTDSYDFMRDAMMNLLQNISDKIDCDFYTTHDIRSISKYCSLLIKKLPNCQYLGNKKIEVVCQKEDGMILYLPCLVNVMEFTKKLQFSIGHYQVYQAYIKKSEFVKDIKPCLLFNQTITEELAELLTNLSIRYEERLVEED